MLKSVTVVPISSKAKNRFANIMGGSNLCEIEQQKDGKVLLASKNRKYFFWVKERADNDWMLSAPF